jgi:hypothetical protein
VAFKCIIFFSIVAFANQFSAHARAVTAIYSMLEPGTFIIAGCMATLRPLFGGKISVSNLRSKLTGTGRSQARNIEQSGGHFSEKSTLQMSSEHSTINSSRQRYIPNDGHPEHLNPFELALPQPTTLSNYPSEDTLVRGGGKTKNID